MGEKHAWHWNVDSELRSLGFHGKDFTNGVSPALKQNYFYTTLRDHAIFKAKDSFCVRKILTPSENLLVWSSLLPLHGFLFTEIL